ncbi:hypothetical protein Celaphus_00017776 [Cervus elaphus hippelaphus]|uniref:Uncharacterized protein n=1 Tax=Cervus elaphus hippelaphus TaxID=46360 RepID=A0A212C6H1_CEREH|nr:hypothetical protein Celaphus_00017776 [Cervus elaphus hippelaphus]
MEKKAKVLIFKGMPWILLTMGSQGKRLPITLHILVPRTTSILFLAEEGKLKHNEKRTEMIYLICEHTQETNSPHSLKKDVENMGKGKEKF